MKTSTRILLSIPTAALEIGAVVLWKYNGIQMAGNFITFWIWVLFVLGILTLIVPSSSDLALKRIPWLSVFNHLTSFLLISLLAAYSEFLLAGLYTSAWLITSAHQMSCRAKKEKLV